ncbi:50S ribosomal protein L29 [Methylolobus aquaticus]|uniref:50S ribosomal protein L29 n=1 Tax=Methylotetracoccus oryzae TaxID=1919059 RepID=UPI00111BCCAE|nr:50S ribosomal protein L29 [Methylotetracoccus oryzae]
MKVNEIRAKSAEELKTQLLDLHKEQFNLRMQKATGQLSKPDQLQKLRKDIARINMVLGEMGVKA